MVFRMGTLDGTVNIDQSGCTGDNCMVHIDLLKINSLSGAVASGCPSVGFYIPSMRTRQIVLLHISCVDHFKKPPGLPYRSLIGFPFGVIHL
jgi:hypothetical protein